MSINQLTYGSPTYSPVFAVSSGDVDVMKLRSRESAPLSHESLDENFTNLAAKINEILGLDIDEITITAGKIDIDSLGVSGGNHIGIDATGAINHNPPDAPAAGFLASSTDLTGTVRTFVSALDFDSYGHVLGYQANVLNFLGSGAISVSETTNSLAGNTDITISSAAYGSGSNPSFGSIMSSLGADTGIEPATRAATRTVLTLGAYRDSGSMPYGSSPYGGFGPAIDFKSSNYDTDTPSVIGRIAATITNDSTTDTGGDLVFSTTSTDTDTADDLVERMRITTAGHLGINTFPGVNLDSSVATMLTVRETDTWVVADFESSHTTGVGINLSPDASAGWSIIACGSTASAGDNVLGIHKTTAELGGDTGYKAYFHDRGLHLTAPNSQVDSTNFCALSIDNEKDHVSMFLGKNQPTTAWGKDDHSGSIRWNGSGQAWGDLTYYPNFLSAGDTGAGQFRFSTAGSIINKTPNAKVGVGSLFASTEISIGSVNPDGFGLRVVDKNVQIYNTQPTIELYDTNAAENDPLYASYLLWKDWGGTQVGFVGYGNTAHNELMIYNQSNEANAGIRIYSKQRTHVQGTGMVMHKLNGDTVASITHDGQGRFGGWHNPAVDPLDGPAVEVGVSGVGGYVLPYDRSTGDYLPQMNVSCGPAALTLDLAGSSVHLKGATTSVASTDAVDRVLIFPSTGTNGMNGIYTPTAGQSLHISTTNAAGALNEGIKIQPTGEVRHPGNPHVSILSGTLSTHGSLTGTATSNIGNHFNTSSGVFTAPLAGKYLVTAAGVFSSVGTWNHSRLWLRFNGMDKWFLGGYAAVTGNLMGFGGSHVAMCNSGDTLNLYYTHSSGVVYDSNFSITYLG